MKKEEKLDFISLYFSGPQVHDNFKIIEKAVSCYKNIPDEVTEEEFVRMTETLLQKRGLFPSLRFIRLSRFPQLKRAFLTIAEQLLMISKKKDSEKIDSITYFDVDYHSRSIMLQPLELYFLFNMKTADDIDAIETFPEDNRNFKLFMESLSLLLLEKKYTSTRNFKLLEINRFTPNRGLVEKAERTILYYMHSIKENETKLFYLLFTFLLLGYEEAEKARLDKIYEKISKNRYIEEKTAQQLITLVKKSGR